MKKKLIKIDELDKADIILSTTHDRISKVVKWGTDSKYSHARLVVKGLQIIEAVDPKVKKTNLYDLLPTDKYTAVYRMPNLSEGQKSTIMAYALKQDGKKYDLVGAVGAAKLSRYSRAGQAAMNFNSIKPERSFYCSELVAFAYKQVGIELSDRPAWNTTPETLARSTKLVYVGHLKM